MTNNTTMILQVIFDKYNKDPGDKVHFDWIRQKLSISEEDLIFQIKKLEERGFVHATWMGRKALIIYY